MSGIIKAVNDKADFSLQQNTKHTKQKKNKSKIKNKTKNKTKQK